MADTKSETTSLLDISTSRCSPGGYQWRKWYHTMRDSLVCFRMRKPTLERQVNTTALDRPKQILSRGRMAGYTILQNQGHWFTCKCSNSNLLEERLRR
jgi:hypothetical protein